LPFVIQEWQWSGLYESQYSQLAGKWETWSSVLCLSETEP
jgi:hypothetical protein